MICKSFSSCHVQPGTKRWLPTRLWCGQVAGLFDEDLTPILLINLHHKFCAATGVGQSRPRNKKQKSYDTTPQRFTTKTMLVTSLVDTILERIIPNYDYTIYYMLYTPKTSSTIHANDLPVFACNTTFRIMQSLSSISDGSSPGTPQRTRQRIAYFKPSWLVRLCCRNSVR